MLSNESLKEFTWIMKVLNSCENYSQIETTIKLFELYRDMGKNAMAQISDPGFHWKPEPESNSIYLIVKHLHGNMLSRWTDFLTSDGEKPWRNRDAEFEDELGNQPGARTSHLTVDLQPEVNSAGGSRWVE
jgi:hypothetical protein